MLALCSCKQNLSEEYIEVVFSPGLVEYNNMKSEIFDSFGNPDRIHVISSSEYSFLRDVFSNPKRDTVGKANPPYVFVNFNSVQYVIGTNHVVESKQKVFSISESENYRIKCIICFYDYIDNVDLLCMPEIKRFGVPTNYHYCYSDSRVPTKPFVKIVLQRQ